MPSLGEDQFAVGEYVFGYGTSVDVGAFDVDYPSVTTQDKPNPREDGILMGIDRLGGRVINIDFEIWEPTEAQALDTLETLSAAFMGDNERLTPQSYQVLSYRLAGTGEQRRAFGRGRACTPSTLVNADRGFIPGSAQFQTIGPLFYSDVEFSDSTGFVPEVDGGLTSPLVGPIYAVGGSGIGSRGFEVLGTRPAWVATRIDGPITYPIVEVSGQWWYQLAMTIPRGESVLVDPQPWSRTVQRVSDGANLSGYLTGPSAWLADMRVPPGWHELTLQGVDPSGSARVTAYWRHARASL